MHKKEYKKNGNNPVFAVCVGTGISIAATLLGTLIISFLIMKGKIEEEAIGYGVLAVILIAASTGAFTTAKMNKKNLVLISMSASVAYWLFMLSLTAMFFGGQYTRVPVTLLVTLAGGMCATFVARRNKEKPKSYRKKLKL